MPFSAIAQTGNGCSVDQTIFRIERYIKTIQSKPQDRRQWSFDLYLASDPDNPSFNSEIKIWEPQMQFSQGDLVEVIHPENSRNPTIIVDEDNRNQPQLVIKSGAEISILQGGQGGRGGRQQPAQQRGGYQQERGYGNRPAPQQQRQQYQGGQQRQQAPQQRHQAPQQGNGYQQRQMISSPRPSSVYDGVAVGAAFNKCMDVITHHAEAFASQHGFSTLYEYFASPAFSQDLHNLTSDSLRVSEMIKQGKIADPIKVRFSGTSKPRQQRQDVNRNEELPADSEFTHANGQGQTSSDTVIIDPGIDGDDIPF